MEHAGATFLNEDGVLFRSMPTPSDYFRRNTLVLHETCHQWFGDLVTMRWFDDLWLKEGFAQYMAYKALATLEPESNPWKHFYEDVKPLAYGIDETLGHNPNILPGHPKSEGCEVGLRSDRVPEGARDSETTGVSNWQ